MSVGENIRKQREAKGLTQKELADKLFVTPQAISRWEKGSVEPSVETLKSISVLFEVSIDDLVSDQTKESSENEAGQPAAVMVPNPPPAPQEDLPAPVPAPAPEPKLIGTCTFCGKAIYEGDPINYRHESVTHYGRSQQLRRVGYYFDSNPEGGSLFCQTCVDHVHEKAKIDAANAAAQKSNEMDKKRHKALGWGISAGIVTFALAIAIGIALLNNNSQSAGIWTLCLSPVMGYMLFSLVFVLIVDNTFVSDVFLEIVSFAAVKMPGVIFSLDFDGIVFLIAVKILFAILSFLIFAGVLAFAVVLSGIFSMFMFPAAWLREPNLD